MRKTILHDIGNPRLKKEVLDLIDRLQKGTLLTSNPTTFTLPQVVKGGTVDDYIAADDSGKKKASLLEQEL